MKYYFNDAELEQLSQHLIQITDYLRANASKAKRLNRRVRAWNHKKRLKSMSRVFDKQILKNKKQWFVIEYHHLSINVFRQLRDAFNDGYTEVEDERHEILQNG